MLLPEAMGVHPVLVWTTPLDIHKHLRRVPALNFALPGERNTKEMETVLDACPFAEVDGLRRHHLKPQFWRSNLCQVGCVRKEGKDLVTCVWKTHRGDQGVHHKLCCVPRNTLQEMVWCYDPCVSTLSAHIPGRWHPEEVVGSRWAAPWIAIAFLTGSMPRSGAPPDSHRDPRTSSRAHPNTDSLNL